MRYVFGEDNDTRKLGTISLSYQTIARRITDLAELESRKVKNITEC